MLTIPFDSFTLFGKCIILALIQIGGIGLLTLWLFIIALFVNLGISTRIYDWSGLRTCCFKNPKRILFFIIGFTLITELLGSLCIYALIAPLYPRDTAIFNAIFHSVSSFCNAGLSVFGQHSMVPFQHNIPLLAVTGILILLGGIGFMTLLELFLFYKTEIRKKAVQFYTHDTRHSFYDGHTNYHRDALAHYY